MTSYYAPNRTIITTATTTQIASKGEWLGMIHVWNVGVTATIDIYDATSGTSNKVFEWVSADGKRSVDLGIKMQNGIRVITGGTFGGCTITHSGV